MLSIADRPKAVRIAVWLGIVIGAGVALSAVEKQLKTQTAKRLRILAERWEIFE